MGQPESRSTENAEVWAQLAARFRRAKEYQEAFQLWTVWANERIARGLSADYRYLGPSVPEDPLVARLRLDPRLGRPPHDYGTMSPYTWLPPQLNPYERRPMNPNQVFYVSPDGGLELTLGQLRNLGQPMLDEAWITQLCTWPPTQEAHRMGVSGGPANSVEHVLKWLDKHTHVDRPDYTAACLDMYFAGVGIREGVLTRQGARVVKNVGQGGPVAKPHAAEPKASREKLEAAQAEARWLFSQERADQVEAARKAERLAANQAAFDRGDIARFEYPEGFDKSKITWSSIGPRGEDQGGDVLYGYDYQGRYVGNRLNGLQDDSGSLLLLGSAAKLAKTGIGALAKGKVASPNMGFAEFGPSEGKKLVSGLPVYDIGIPIRPGRPVRIPRLLTPKEMATLTNDCGGIEFSQTYLRGEYWLTRASAAEPATVKVLPWAPGETRWVSHSHPPGYSMTPSPQDMRVLDLLDQNASRIVRPDGTSLRYTR